MLDSSTQTILFEPRIARPDIERLVNFSCFQLVNIAPFAFTRSIGDIICFCLYFSCYIFQKLKTCSKFLLTLKWRELRRVLVVRFKTRKQRAYYKKTKGLVRVALTRCLQKVVLCLLGFGAIPNFSGTFLWSYFWKIPGKYC